MDKKQTTTKERVENAIEVAFQYGQIDGDHHKTWVIDQMVRKLLTPVQYKRFLEDYEEVDEEGELQYEWGTGIAP